ncbi:MAG: YHS domain-containing (seleno)protein [Paracoccus sp. (in: a-proteobacteria)]|nr:YHS domain-containing (seleno)protein [Paracoccus sp. (in: a-proteobacteria)]
MIRLKPLLLAMALALPLAVSAQEWALGGYDPVAYVTRNSAVPGQSGISTEWRGKQYHFASEENRALFEANPRAYTPGFDGLCVVALSEGRTEPGDPKLFVTIGQRVYLVRSEARRRILIENPRELLMKAKNMWLQGNADE